MTHFEVRFISDNNKLSGPNPPKDLWYTDEGLLAKNQAQFKTQAEAEVLMNDLQAEFMDKDIPYQVVIAKVEVVR